jgi:hypothetical protein
VRCPPRTARARPSILPRGARRTRTSRARRCRGGVSSVGRPARSGRGHGTSDKKSSGGAGGGVGRRRCPSEHRCGTGHAGADTRRDRECDGEMTSFADRETENVLYFKTRREDVDFSWCGWVSGSGTKDPTPIRFTRPRRLCIKNSIPYHTYIFLLHPSLARVHLLVASCGSHHTPLVRNISSHNHPRQLESLEPRRRHGPASPIPPVPSAASPQNQPPSPTEPTPIAHAHAHTAHEPRFKRVFCFCRSLHTIRLEYTTSTVLPSLHLSVLLSQPSGIPTCDLRPAP